MILTSGPADEIAWANAVVFEGQQFLVVWTSAPHPFPNADFSVWGQYWSKTGQAQGSPFAIETVPGMTLGAGLSRLDGKLLALINTGLLSPDADVCAKVIARPCAAAEGVFPIATTGALEFGMLAAFNGTNYLVTWSQPDVGIRGRFVTPQGDTEGSELPISGDLREARETAIGFDGTNFLVVFNGGSGNHPYIYGRFVSPTGVVGTQPFSIDTGSGASDNPLSVAFDGANYLVVFNEHVSGTEVPGWDVLGRLVNPSGVVSTNRLVLAGGPGHQRFPFEVWDGACHLASWSEMSTQATLTLRLRFFDPTGQPLGPAFSPFAAQGGNAPALSAPLFDGGRAVKP